MTGHRTSPTALESPTTTVLSFEGRGAITALARGFEAFDPDAASRAAALLVVLDTTAEAMHVDDRTRADAAIATLLLSMSPLLTRSPAGELERSDALLMAQVADRLSGIGDATTVLRECCERWDGNGVPFALKGEQISIAARLVAATRLTAHLLDDAPTAAAVVRDASGSALDPQVADAMLVGFGALADQYTMNAALAIIDRLVRSERRTASPTEALESIGAAIEAADRMDEVLVLMAEHARRALDASTVSIARYDRERRVIDVLVNVGDLAPGSERYPAGETYRLDDHPYLASGIASRTVRRALSVSDHTDADELERRGICSEILAPIEVAGDPWGLMLATNTIGRDELAPADVATLRLAAEQVGTGVTQARRFAELEELALRDPLTGLGNRRVLEGRLREIFDGSPLDRQDVAVIMCDVDGLKTINDTMGHEVGDVVLVEAAAALRDAVADIDGTSVCRIGGDEFCVLVEHGGLLSGPAIARRAAELFERAGNDRSFSCGVAVAGVEMETPSDLLRAADEAQYREKALRRGARDAEREALDHADTDRRSRRRQRR